MDRHLIARAIEIATGSDKPIMSPAALRRALDEMLDGDYERAIDMLAAEGQSRMKYGKKRTHILPEQPTLFDLPTAIAIATPVGDLWLRSDLASAGQVDQWAREGEQDHASQLKRFKAIRAQLKELALDPSENYLKQIRAIASPDSE